MKKCIFLSIFAMCVLCLVSCRKNSIDPIHGTVQLDSTFMEGAPDLLLENARLDQDTFMQRVLFDSNRRFFTRNIVRKYPEVSDSAIHFLHGSGVVTVEAGDGKSYSGSFKDEIVVAIDSVGSFFLWGGNKVVGDIEWQSCENWGSVLEHQFMLQPGETMENHLSKLQSWASVSEFPFSIRDSVGDIVTTSTYKDVLGKYIFEDYDVFDVALGTIRDREGNLIDAEKLSQRKNAKKSE